MNINTTGLIKMLVNSSRTICGFPGLPGTHITTKFGQKIRQNGEVKATKESRIENKLQEEFMGTLRDNTANP